MARIETVWARKRFLERKNQVLEENYHLLSEVYRENERLYHDMNHHLQMIYYLAQKAGQTEVMDYVTSVSTPINQLSNVIWSGVDIVDAILNHAIAEAKQNGITMDVNVEFPRNSNIASDDLCVILFNLLDNAMDACKKCKVDYKEQTAGIREKESIVEMQQMISVTIRRIQKFLMIKVRNPCTRAPKRRFGWFLSTKENPAHHGIGLRNVREKAEKYNGNVEFEIKDGMFVTSVLLFIPQQ
ncbi:MAG: GHKL domain-containing protein [Lachnospiraceae bacterium]|nr:GHKL domain-containing protein [Lachnospiraceae bacterium]